MSLNTANIEETGGGKKSAPIESGNYLARVVQVIDLGRQNQRPYMGQEKPPQTEISVTYELASEFLKDDDGNDRKDKPRWMSEIMPLFPLWAERAKSTKRMNALDPKNELNGDFSLLTGHPCTLTLEQNEGKGKHAGKTFVNVTQVTPPMKGVDIPLLVNEPKVFDLDEPDMEVFNSLPDWIKSKIKGNLDYIGSPLSKSLEGGASGVPVTSNHVINDDDIPF